MSQDLTVWWFIAMSGVLSCVASETAHAQRIGITADTLQVFDDASIPAKEFRVLRTTYAPTGENPKHYHTSHVVFYVLEGAGLWQEDGKEPITLRAGETLHVRPGVIHSHRNSSSSEKLVFLEFVILEKGQRSTIPVR
jgi:quercetin dioxygenase-like cupin family protein